MHHNVPSVLFGHESILYVYRNVSVRHSVCHIFRGYFKKKSDYIAFASEKYASPRFPRQRTILTHRGRMWLCRYGFQQSMLLRH